MRQDQDFVDEITNGFVDGLKDAQLKERDVGLKQAYELGRRAALFAVAPFVWASEVGECLNTRAAIDALGITRQAISKRVASGTLLGVPGRQTTLFPVWQFDFSRSSVRPVVPEILREWQGQGVPVDPLTVAVWARTAQDDLDGATPEDWVVNGRDDALVVIAARRAAKALAR